MKDDCIISVYVLILLIDHRSSSNNLAKGAKLLAMIRSNILGDEGGFRVQYALFHIF
jgi:hypothetical protein